MQRTTVERAGIEVSRLAFGTGSMHRLFSRQDRQLLLARAAAVGMTHFDTSPYYGYGLAEVDLGRFLKGQREDFTVTTKVGLYPWMMPARSATEVWVRKVAGRIVSSLTLPAVNWQLDRAKDSLRQSLRRIRTDYVDFLLLHEPIWPLMHADEFLKWLLSEQYMGNVRAWGIAGVAERIAPWVEFGHPLASVVQTQDSLAGREADFLTQRGRGFQFTYGYLASLRAQRSPMSAVVALRTALARNTTGSIIVSTRRADRFPELARAAS